MHKSFRQNSRILISCRWNTDYVQRSIPHVQHGSWRAGRLVAWVLSGWAVESLSLPAVAMPHFILRGRQTAGESSTVFPFMHRHSGWVLWLLVNKVSEEMDTVKWPLCSQISKNTKGKAGLSGTTSLNPVNILNQALWRHTALISVYRAVQIYCTAVQTSGFICICPHTHVVATVWCNLVNYSYCHL